MLLANVGVFIYIFFIGLLSLFWTAPSSKVRWWWSFFSSYASISGVLIFDLLLLVFVCLCVFFFIYLQILESIWSLLFSAIWIWNTTDLKCFCSFLLIFWEFLLFLLARNLPSMCFLANQIVSVVRYGDLRGSVLLLFLTYFLCVNMI